MSIEITIVFRFISLHNGACYPQIHKLMIILSIIVVIYVIPELFIPLLDSFLPPGTCHIYEDFTVCNYDGEDGAFHGLIQYATIIATVQELTPMVFINQWFTVCGCVVCLDGCSWCAVATALASFAGFAVY